MTAYTALMHMHRVVKIIKRKRETKIHFIAAYAISQTKMIANLCHYMEHSTNQQIVTITKRTIKIVQIDLRVLNVSSGLTFWCYVD